ncbi:inositol 1,4,5-trisphosphate receptor-interacting protein-like 1 [Larus michahellis]|uniref:inositol 1,4,5-trisphosphate receptor-interacting protein-like 1 n=1 Tax=Larus michahellis TaxID=119627 RepID=UPI003D9B6727
MVLALPVLSIFQLLPMVGDELDEATRKRVQQRVERLSHLIQLLHDLEQRSWEQRIQQLAFPWRAVLFAALQQWHIWAVAGVLVLIFGLSWELRKWSAEEEEEEGEEPLHISRFLDECPLWPLTNRQGGVCVVVEQVVNDLLCFCRILSGNAFMPRVQPVVGVGTFRDSQSADGGDLVYRLLVPLKPPPGHSFHLELGSKKDKLVRNTRLRVELECMCRRERWLGDMLCFLHHSEDKLMTVQEASLLQTLCTDAYLDVQKTAFWLQQMMTAASTLVPVLGPCTLTVLPSRRFCKFKLTNSVNVSLYIELILAVQKGDTFVSME